MKKIFVMFTMLMFLVTIVPFSLAETTDNDSLVCCEAMTADCLACAQGLSVDVYCEDNSDVDGCETIVSDSEEMNVTLEDEEEVEIMITPYGAEVRLAQLKLSIERNIEQGNAVIEENNFSEEVLAELNSILADLEVLKADVNSLSLDSKSSVLAEEFVAIKKQARTLSSDFKNIVHEEVSADKIEAMKERVRQRSQKRINSLREQIKEKQNNYQLRKANQLAKRFGVDLKTNKTVNEIVSEIKSKVANMSEDQQNKLMNSYKESLVRNKIESEAIKEKTRVNAIKRYEDKKEELQNHLRLRIQNSSLSSEEKERLENRLEESILKVDNLLSKRLVQDLGDRR